MEKENYTIEDLREALNDGDNSKVIDIVDEFDLKKIKDNNLLSQIADVYARMRMYDQEKRALELAYENTNVGRNLAYRLCLASVKTKDFAEAKEYYEDFVEMAPRDTGRYVLKYKMAKGKGASPEKLIEILEEYVNIDMEERWAYELAKLYHMIGDEEKCIDMCDELSLWFSEGTYVIKAMELKKMYQPLTTSQQQKYNMALEKQQVEEEKKEIAARQPEVVEEINDEDIWFDEEDEIKEVEETPVFPEIEIKTEDPNRFNTMDMQAVIANGMKEVVLDFGDEEVIEQVDDVAEETPVEPVFNDLNDVSAFLRELQERGVLKAETVSQAVNIIEGQESTNNIESTVEEKTEESVVEDIVEENIEENVEEMAAENIQSESKPEIDIFGATREFGTSIAKEAVNILEQPTQALPSADEVEKAVVETVVPKEDGVPVLDLGFEDNSVDTNSNESEITEEQVDTAKLDNEAIQEIEEDEVSLTEEELEAFKNYVNVEGFDSNIKEVLRDLITNYQPNGKSETGNVMILGNEKTGKTTLAIEIIKLVNKKRGRRNRRLVKVDANALNRRGFRNSLNKLLGSDLIIENANVLGAMTISEIIDVCGMFTDDMLIVLEGDGDGMDILMKNTPRISDVFNNVVRIREYDIKEWAQYGKEYALQQGYTMDDLANLAFFKAIDDFYGANKGIGQADVDEIVNSAIARSQRKLFGNKKNEDGYAILVEKDFNI